MLLLSRKHNNYTWHLTHYIWHHSHCICGGTSTVLLRSQKLWKLSHLAHVWHHTHSTWHHNHTLWHHSSVSMTPQPLNSWHQMPYIWHHLQVLWHLVPYTCDISDTVSEYISTIFIIKHTVHRQYNHYIWNHNLHMCFCVITHSVSMI